uniref:DNA-directed RNA polymerase III subunit n=1 Tax=Lepisosteus oculatus TaxID=7918 RepID=W5MNJ0_LEPOC
MAMAGRGRGRGRGQMSFNVEAMGLGKGEPLPPSTLQPTPLFPPMENKPVPLQAGEEAEYMLALKQELRGAMKNLPYFVRPAVPKKDVERYSDKYQSSEPTDNTIEWTPDWNRLPRELRIRVRKPPKETVKRKVKEPLQVPKRSQQKRVDKEEIIRKLEVRTVQTLEKKEQEVSSEEEEEEKKQEEEEQENEEEYDEEEFEEETDYVMSYFDNGEEFGADSDDNMDEAIY